MVRDDNVSSSWRPGSSPRDQFAAREPQKIVLELRGGTSRYGQFLVEELRKQIDVKWGGDVQLALGRSHY